MRSAPAVSMVCGRGGAWRMFVALMPGLACTVLAAWALGHAQLAAWPALLLLAPVSAIVWRLARPVAVALAWDGQCWTADGAIGKLQLMIDLGPWMLLRLRPDDAQRPALWLPVAAADAGPAWHGLRAAVHGRAPQPGPEDQAAAAGTAVKAD